MRLVRTAESRSETSSSCSRTSNYSAMRRYGADSGRGHGRNPALLRITRGALPGSWLTIDHVGALARYRTVVCLENATVPYYFTEKFVNAARAGCVPVYHAHRTIRQTVLKGAAWIDPGDYGFNAPATLDAASRCDAEAIRRQNWAWLESEQLKQTNGWRIWSRVADYFVARVAARRGASRLNRRPPVRVSAGSVHHLPQPAVR